MGTHQRHKLPHLFRECVPAFSLDRGQSKVTRCGANAKIIIRVPVKVKPDHLLPVKHLLNHQPCHQAMSMSLPSRNQSLPLNSLSSFKLFSFLSKLYSVLPNDGCTSFYPVFVPLVFSLNPSFMMTPKLFLANEILPRSKVIIPWLCLVC